VSDAILSRPRAGVDGEAGPARIGVRGRALNHDTQVTSPIFHLDDELAGAEVPQAVLHHGAHGRQREHRTRSTRQQLRLVREALQTRRGGCRQRFSQSGTVGHKELVVLNQGHTHSLAGILKAQKGNMRTNPHGADDELVGLVLAEVPLRVATATPLDTLAHDEPDG
jgi:hypothetical protein